MFGTLSFKARESGRNCVEWINNSWNNTAVTLRKYIETIFVSSICVFTLFFQSLAFGDLSDGNASIYICDWNLKWFICIPLHALSYGCPPCVMWRWFCFHIFSAIYLASDDMKPAWEWSGKRKGWQNCVVRIVRGTVRVCRCRWFLFVLKISITGILRRLERVNISIRGRVIFTTIDTIIFRKGENEFSQDIEWLLFV